MRVSDIGYVEIGRVYVPKKKAEERKKKKKHVRAWGA
jgi:hypothetical protein